MGGLIMKVNQIKDNYMMTFIYCKNTCKMYLSSKQSFSITQDQTYSKNFLMKKMNKM